MTSPLEYYAGFRPAVCSLSHFGIPRCERHHFLILRPELADLDLFTGLPQRFEELDFASANQCRSHPPMSVTRNLVSDRARRIPERVFKIHERCAPAMKFTTVAVTEIVARVPGGLRLLRYFAQHVGVVRNFDVETVYQRNVRSKFF
jgi:hypothetical protein